MSVSPPSPQVAADELRPWIERLTGRAVLIWGDVVADRFLYGATTRVSREAPALVLRYEADEIRPGGAGNAMMNVATLGGHARAVGFLGSDAEGDALADKLSATGVDTRGLVRRADSPTPVKTRIMAGGLHTVRQQVLRIDHDPAWPTDEGAGAELLKRLRDGLAGAAALLISDYGLACVRPEIWEELRPEIANKPIPVVLDSRGSLLGFPGVTAATPNEEEVEQALGIRLDADLGVLEDAGHRLVDTLGCQALVITRGSSGMSVFDDGNEPVHLPIHGTDEIADVTGAGDAVIATFTLALAAGARTLVAARLANIAGGLAVTKRGTAPVSTIDLLGALEETR